MWCTLNTDLKCSESVKTNIHNLIFHVFCVPVVTTDISISCMTCAMETGKTEFCCCNILIQKPKKKYIYMFSFTDILDFGDRSSNLTEIL